MTEELRRQIDVAEIVILPLAILTENPVLAAFKVDAVRRLNKPVLAVRAFGESAALLDTADDMAESDEGAIIESTKRLARGDRSGQPGVIDCKLD